MIIGVTIRLPSEQATTNSESRRNVRNVDRLTVGTDTGLAPLIGYAAAADLAKEALASNRTIVAIAAERGLLDERRLGLALSATSLAGLH